MASSVDGKRARSLMTRVWLFGLAALAISTGGGLLGAAAASPHQPRAGVTHSRSAEVDETELLNGVALGDLQVLRSRLTFKPLLPSGLELPAGHHYNRVVWASTPVTGFGIFISSRDPTAGSRAIHMDEGLLSASDLADPRLPMNAFKSILRPVTLGNGVWFEMQQQHAPFQGEWILMAVDGNVAVQIDGLDSKELLERFAAGLVR